MISKSAKQIGIYVSAFFEKAEVTQDEKKPNHLLVAMTSDRGLCGAVHSNIVRAIRAYMAEHGKEANIKLITIGDKARSMLCK